MKPVYLLLPSLVATLMASGCQALVKQTEIEMDDYAVYSAFLNELPFAENLARKNTIVIRDTTAISATDVHVDTPWSWRANYGNHSYKEDLVRCEEAHSTAWEPLYEAMKKQFYQPRFKIGPHFAVSYPTQLLSQAQLKQRSNQAGNPHFIFSFSNVVYDASKTRALFFSRFWGEGLCGRGELAMLRKVNQRWVLIETFQCWIT